MVPKDRPVKLSRLLTALLIIGGLADCNLKEKYARNNFPADQWLQANVGSAGVNVQGAWEARESGWGDIRFEQLGSSVNGAIGIIPLGASIAARGSSWLKARVAMFIIQSS